MEHPGSVFPDLFHLGLFPLLFKFLLLEAFDLSHGGLELVDEVAVLVQVEGNLLVRICLYLLVHRQSIVNLQLEPAFELLMRSFGLLVLEALVEYVCDLHLLFEIALLIELFADFELFLFQLLSKERLFGLLVALAPGGQGEVLAQGLLAFALGSVVEVVQDVHLATLVSSLDKRHEQLIPC